MSRVNLIQGSFSAGEVSPKLHGRMDLDKFASGLAECTNLILQPQGGIYRRSGTVYVAEVKDSTKDVVLIPFYANNSLAYVVEAGPNYFRFFTQHGQLLDDGGDPVEMVTPYTESELRSLDYAQSADTLFIVHPNHAPVYMKRETAMSFSLSDFDFQDGPYMNANLDSGWYINNSAAPDACQPPDASSPATPEYFCGTVTLSVTGPDLFAATDIGRWVRFRYLACWGAAKITGFTDPAHVTASIPSYMAVNFSGQNTSDWRLGSWSDTTGWPSCVTFNDGRIFFGNTPNETQGVWFSKSGVFNVFSPTHNNVNVTDDNGGSYTVSGNLRNDIKYLLSAQSLMVGTSTADWAVNNFNQSSPISPTNIAFKQYSTYGSAKVRPFIVGTSIIYVQKSGQKLREQTYDWSGQTFQSVEISILSEHLIREGGGIVQATFQQEPDSCWWGCRKDGVLVGMTYMKDQKIVGFHKHIIGGTNAQVKSVCSIPHPDGTQDELWLIVKRRINNVDVQYVEYMDKPFLPSGENDQSLMNFVDCGLKYDDAPETHITGLLPLTGETVAICGDGNELPPEIVSNSGTIDLQQEVSLAYIGLPYQSKGQMLPTPVQGDAGSAQGKFKRIDRIIFRVLHSKGFKSGPDYDHLRNIVLLTTANNMTSAVPLTTGDVEIYSPSGYDKLCQFVFVQDKPYPLNILCATAQMQVTP